MVKRNAFALLVAAAIAASGHYASAQLGAELPSRSRTCSRPIQKALHARASRRLTGPIATSPSAVSVLRAVRSERDGSGWKTDYPYSEINLLIRLGR